MRLTAFYSDVMKFYVLYIDKKIFLLHYIVSCIFMDLQGKFYSHIIQMKANYVLLIAHFYCFSCDKNHKTYNLSNLYFTTYLITSNLVYQYTVISLTFWIDTPGQTV